MNELESLQNQNKEHCAMNETLRGKLKSERVYVVELKERLDISRGRVGELSTHVMDRDKEIDLQESIAQTNYEKFNVKCEELNAALTVNKEQEKLIMDFPEQFKELKEKTERQNKVIDEKNKTVEKLCEDKASFREEISTLERSNKDHHDHEMKMAGIISDVQAENDEIQKHCKILEDERNPLIISNRELNAKIINAKAAIVEMKKEIERKRKDAKQHGDDKVKLAAVIAELKEELSKQNGDLNAKITDLYDIVKRKNDRIKMIELESRLKPKWGIMLVKENWSIGGYWSSTNKTLCVSVLPCITFWFCKPTGTAPQGKDIYRSDA